VYLHSTLLEAEIESAPWEEGSWYLGYQLPLIPSPQKKGGKNSHWDEEAIPSFPRRCNSIISK